MTDTLTNDPSGVCACIFLKYRNSIMHLPHCISHFFHVDLNISFHAAVYGTGKKIYKYSCVTSFMLQQSSQIYDERGSKQLVCGGNKSNVFKLKVILLRIKYRIEIVEIVECK